MVRLVVIRALQAFPVLFIVSSVIFLLIHTAPGGPENVLIDPRTARSADLLRIRKNLGLDRPLPVQYLDWSRRLVRLDLGRSYVSGQLVVEIIRERFGQTLLLMGSALLLAICVSVPLGTYSAYKHTSPLSQVMTVFSYLGVSAPAFWFGLVLIYLFAVRFGWLPSGGTRTIGSDFSMIDRFKHLILPALVLSFAFIATLVRQVRANVLSVLYGQHVIAARAKGLSEFRVLVRHVLPIGLYPVVTVVGLMFSSLVAGSVVIESLFGWNGLGRSLVVAVTQRDYPVVIGLSLFVSIFVLVGNALADIMYLVLDPRQRNPT